MRDAAGLESLAEVTITLHGANDTPTAFADMGISVEAGGAGNNVLGSNATGNVLTNDGDVDSMGYGETKSVIGVVAGVQSSANSNVGAMVAGIYGAIQIAADGSYTYIVDDSNASVQALRTSTDTLDEVFTYSMVDAAGLTSTTQITVTIQGANDTPFDLVTSGLATHENAVNGTVVGSLSSADLDAGDTLTYTLTDDAGGRFAIDISTGVLTVADGTLLNYEVNTQHAVIVRVTDGAGAFYDEAFSIAISDVNEFNVSTPTDFDSAANLVTENALIGTVVGVTANAVDPDGAANGVSYSLFDDDGAGLQLMQTRVSSRWLVQSTENRMAWCEPLWFGLLRRTVRLPIVLLESALPISMSSMPVRSQTWMLSRI